MVLKKTLAAAALLAVSRAACAGFIFFPGLDEYLALPTGEYDDYTVAYTSIDKVYDEKGDKETLAAGSVPGGEAIKATLFLPRFLWIGNIFRDTHVPILSSRNQVLRVIQPLGFETATDRLAQFDKTFGLDSEGAGLGDTFVLAGIYGKTHHWGPVNFNGLLATTLKIPTLGQYDRDSLLNIGTNYWTVAPQLAFHDDFYGKLFMDWTVAYQLNGRNRKPAFGGLDPSDPANLYNVESSFGWKWTERLYSTVGVLFRATTAANKFKNPTVNLADQPVPANPPLIQTPGLVSGSAPLPLPEPPNPAVFFVSPKPGTYVDQGVRASLVTFGMNYVYRDSLVFDFRFFKPVGGKGSFFTLPFDVFQGEPDGMGGFQKGPFLTTVDTRVSGVGEAAAIPASPLLLFRIVFLPWAP